MLDMEQTLKEIEKMGIIASSNAIVMIFTSIGCHFLNLQQKYSEPFLVRGSMPVDLRKHLMFVRIPGTGKTTLLNFLYEILPEELKKAGQVRFENYITEAGFAGTLREVGGRVKEIPGIAKMCEKGFVIVEEFSSVLSTFGTTHSSTFEQTLLLALDSGKVIKTLAPGELCYETNLTFCCGIQPIRLAPIASSGLLRRFLVEFYIPNWQTMERIRKAARKSWLKSQSKRSEIISKIKSHISSLMDNIVIDLDIDEKIFDFFDNMKIPVAIESDIYMQSLLGYNFFIGNIEDGTLIVELDKFSKNMIIVDYLSRQLINYDMPSLVVMSIIRDIAEEGGYENAVSLLDIYERSSIYNISFDEIQRAIDRLVKLSILRLHPNTAHFAVVNKGFVESMMSKIEKIQELVQ